MKNTSTATSFVELQKFSLINSLKRKIKELCEEVVTQKQIIQAFKHNTKTTKINQQQIEIQKLNDENKRLCLMIEDLNKKDSIRNSLNSKNITLPYKRNESQCSEGNNNQENMDIEVQKAKHKRKSTKENFQNKYYNLLMENEKLQKQVLKYKINQNLNKKKKCLSDRNSIMMEKNNLEMDKIRQKNLDLEAELKFSKQKTKNLNEKILQLERIVEIAQTKSIKNI